MKKREIICGITMGDPSGIGPEVILKSLQKKALQRLAKFLIIGNSYVLEKTAQLYNINLKMDIRDEDTIQCREGRGIALLNVGSSSRVVFGQPGISSGRLVLECIQAALKLIKFRKIDVLVTAPVNKHTINQIYRASQRKRQPAGKTFRGHTEYLAEGSKTKNFAMMLVGGPLKVTLVTRHIALKEVAKNLTKKKIVQAIRLTSVGLQKYFGIKNPRIGICGLNPHSGDEGVIGTEESRVIQPAVEESRNFANVDGPLPADTLFYLALHKGFDGCVAMYHDQGLIPLKMLAFHQGVNLTLGLPFVRTSPGHGTAYNIAGKNMANPNSMIEAIKLALKIGLKIKK